MIHDRIANSDTLSVARPVLNQLVRRFYACGQCDKLFTDTSLLHLHSQTSHSFTPRSHSCPECRKDFATSSGLKQHQHIHNSVKPFRCDVCFKAYTQFSNLCRHKRMHADCRQKIKCHDCRQAFATLMALNKHRRFCDAVSHHNNASADSPDAASAFYGRTENARNSMGVTGALDGKPAVGGSQGSQFSQLSGLIEAPSLRAWYMHLYETATAATRPLYPFNIASSGPYLQAPYQPLTLTGTPQLNGHHQQNRLQMPLATREAPAHSEAYKLFQKYDDETREISTFGVRLDRNVKNGASIFVAGRISLPVANDVRDDESQSSVRVDSENSHDDLLCTDGDSKDEDLQNDEDEYLSKRKKRSVDVINVKLPSKVNRDVKLQGISESSEVKMKCEDKFQITMAEELKCEIKQQGCMPLDLSCARKSTEASNQSCVQNEKNKTKLLNYTTEKEEFRSNSRDSSISDHSSSQKVSAVRIPSPTKSDEIEMKYPKFEDFWNRPRRSEPQNNTTPLYRNQTERLHHLSPPVEFSEDGATTQRIQLRDYLRMRSGPDFLQGTGFERPPVTSPLLMPSPMVAASAKQLPDIIAFKSAAAVVPGNKPGGRDRYACRFCGKVFPRSANLTRHLRTHTGEQPYKCKYCRRCFSISSNLQRHVRNIHNKERPFKCPLCDRCFGQQTNLDRHVRKHDCVTTTAQTDDVRYTPQNDDVRYTPQNDMTSCLSADGARREAQFTFRHPLVGGMGGVEASVLGSGTLADMRYIRELQAYYHFKMATNAMAAAAVSSKGRAEGANVMEKQGVKCEAKSKNEWEFLERMQKSSMENRTLNGFETLCNNKKMLSATLDENKKVLNTTLDDKKMVWNATLDGRYSNDKSSRVHQNGASKEIFEKECLEKRVKVPLVDDYVEKSAKEERENINDEGSDVDYKRESASAHSAERCQFSIDTVSEDWKSEHSLVVDDDDVMEAENMTPSCSDDDEVIDVTVADESEVGLEV